MNRKTRPPALGSNSKPTTAEAMAAYEPLADYEAAWDRAAASAQDLVVGKIELGNPRQQVDTAPVRKGPGQRTIERAERAEARVAFLEGLLAKLAPQFEGWGVGDHYYVGIDHCDIKITPAEWAELERLAGRDAGL